MKHTPSRTRPSQPRDAHYQEALDLFNCEQYAAAAHILKQALETPPGHQPSIALLIKALMNDKRAAEAVAYLDQLDYKKNGDACSLAVDVYVACKDFAAAQALIERDLKKNRHSTNLLKLSELYGKRGDLEGARKLMYQAHEMDPKQDLILGKAIIDEHFSPTVKLTNIRKQQQRWERLYAHTGRKTANTRRTPYKVLRIGLLSDGFSNHPVARMTSGSLLRLPRNEFRLYGYSSTDKPDDITKQVQAGCHAWREITKLDDESLNEIIRRDRIDILIDMSGYHKGTRLRMLSMRPAPIIIKWVGGLLNSMGLSFIDYLISDRYESPLGTDSDYTEKLIRMPHGYISYTPPNYVPDTATPPVLGNGYVTFGCFNNANKLNEITIQAWSRILAQTPESRLLLKGSLYEGSEFKQKILNGFNGHGISAERIQFEGQSDHRSLLETYNKVDITLDPWPFSGGLTTLESMLMAVPVVTLPGPTFASRHSTSHVSNAGYPELVASSWEQYASLACMLANDIELLTSLRSEMRSVFLNSPVCNHDSFSASLRQALLAIWQRHCDGKPTAALHVQQDHQVRFEDEDAARNIAPLKAIKDHSDFSFQLKRPIVVIDHGARLVRDARFADLYATGALHVICFDPAALTKELLLPLNRKHFQLVEHIILGDGTPADFKAQLDNSLSGTLAPASSDATPLASFPLPTSRLDDLERDESIDWLMLSDNFDNAKVIAHGHQTLTQALAVTIKVHFAPTHPQHLDISQCRDLLAPFGLEFYNLTSFDCINAYTDQDLKKQYAGSRALSALALFIPKDTQALTQDRLEKLAFILHTYFGAHDQVQKLMSDAGHPEAGRYLSQARNRHLPSIVIPDMPAMSKAEIELFESCLENAEHYYEFGSGGSTKLAASMGLNVHGVESDRAWLRQLTDEVGERCHVRHVDIGPTREWGYPVDLSASDRFPEYSRSIHSNDLAYDLILVDGRFRVACTLESIDYVLRKDNVDDARIFIHDFWNREYYKPVLEFLDSVQTIETAGVFKIRKDLDLNRLKTLKTLFHHDFR